MTDLICCVGSEPGTIAHVIKVVSEQEWDKVFLVGVDSFGVSGELVKVDEDRSISELSDDIYNALKGKLNDFEVAVNIVSGSGKMHTALLSAVSKLGVGLRFVIYSKEGVREV